MHLAEIRVHPIKSCRPVHLDRATVGARGLRHDRRYMVVDATGTFVTLRTLPQLAAIDVQIAEDHYLVDLPDGATFALPHEPDTGPWVQVGVWGDAVWARELPEAGALLSAWTGLQLRLVGMVDDTSTRALPDGSGALSFADAYPLMVLGQASVDDLSRRVGTAMVVDRFRPNLLIDGAEPYEEDTFASVRVGAASLRGATLCSRCVATTIDPATGEFGKEPLTTLAGYRRFDRQVYLGMNLVPTEDATLAVGDAVVVEARHTDRPLH